MISVRANRRSENRTVSDAKQTPALISSQNRWDRAVQAITRKGDRGLLVDLVGDLDQGVQVKRPRSICTRASQHHRHPSIRIQILASALLRGMSYWNTEQVAPRLLVETRVTKMSSSHMLI